MIIFKVGIVDDRWYNLRGERLWRILERLAAPDCSFQRDKRDLVMETEITHNTCLLNSEKQRWVYQICPIFGKTASICKLIHNLLIPLFST
jgi:hypothetical protein